MSITPKSPAINQQGWVQTWVTSQWKNPSIPGQLSAEINRQGSFEMENRGLSPIIGFRYLPAEGEEVAETPGCGVLTGDRQVTS